MRARTRKTMLAISLTLCVIILIIQADSSVKSTLSLNHASPNPRRRMVEYTIVAEHPHDPSAFTEGLFFYKNNLYESTGRSGSSFIRKVNVSTGGVIQEFTLPKSFFGEGIAIVNDMMYMLTYKAKKGFILDPESFNIVGDFVYETETKEGWGMTSNGVVPQLIVSDGSATIFVWEPSTSTGNTVMNVVRTFKVTQDGKPIRRINELEFIKGQLWANVWFTNRLLRIDLDSGEVLQSIDLSLLVPHVTSLNGLSGNDKYNAVMNGIAFNPKNQHVYVTGKLWDKMFELDFPSLLQ